MSELNKKVLISLPDTLLHEIDMYVDSQGVSRSQIIREAIKEYIACRKKAELAQQLKTGYQLMADINLQWAEMCFEADNETSLRYEEKLAECE